MKKLLCLFLSLAIFCLAGCSGDENSSLDTGSIDNEIETAVSEGRFDMSDYGIGAEVAKVQEYYSGLVEDYEALHMGDGASEGHEDEAHVHDHNDELKIPYYDEDEKDGYTEIDVSDIRFYYETENKDKGITVIATDVDVFGFTMGITTKQEVEEAIGDKGKTINATADEIRFLAFPTEPLIILRYEYENRELDFYFYDNAIVTTLIRDKG